MPVSRVTTTVKAAVLEVPSKVRRTRTPTGETIVRPVRIDISETPEALSSKRAALAPALRYGAELTELWDPDGDPERFVYRAILVVALATVDKQIAGWGQLLAARPQPGESTSSRAFCRVSRLDVSPDYRRRRFADSRSGQPVSLLLLNALLAAAPYGAEVVAEVTPDAENLFEQAGFQLRPSGRWLYLR